MAVYVCGCLNVKIHAREAHPVQDNVVDESQPFLSRKVAEVILDDQGIVIEQSYLLHRESTNTGWVHYQCVNCSWRTHAVRSASDTNTVLINMQLESDPANILRRTHSPEFSSAFNIILMNHDLENVKIPDGPVYESLESGVNQVQEQLSAYLGQEKAAMEDRIRTFEQEQRSLFAQLQAQCEKEKSHLISLVVKCATQEEPQTGRGDKSSPSKTGHPTSSPSSKSKPGYGGGQRIKTRSYSQYDQNPDSEALFYLDELEPDLDEEPFYDSGEDDFSAKSSEGNVSNNRTTSESSKHDQLMYSTSVPISVPMWQGRRSSSTEEEEEEVVGENAFKSPKEDVYSIDLKPLQVTPADPDQMAANMQALAESITDTGRYIFGERPRPRLNTGDGMTRYSERPMRRRLNTADSVNRRK